MKWIWLRYETCISYENEVSFIFYISIVLRISYKKARAPIISRNLELIGALFIIPIGTPI